MQIPSFLKKGELTGYKMPKYLKFLQSKQLIMSSYFETLQQVTGYSKENKKESRILPGSTRKYLESFDGVKIYYDVNLGADKKNFIIFVLGLGGCLTAWDQERIMLKSQGYSTLALDLRGHGLSDRPNKSKFYNCNNFAKDILEIIEKEKIESCSVVGHCVGGMVTILLGAKMDPRIKSIVLIDTSYRPPYFSKIISDRKYLQNMLSVLFEYSPDFGFRRHNDFSKFIGTEDYSLKRIAYDVAFTSVRSYLLASAAFCKFNATNLLPKIEVPTLIIQGLKDKIFPPYLAFDLNERIKGSRVEFIEDANHILVINNPEVIVEKLDLFLKGFVEKKSSDSPVHIQSDYL